MYLISLFYDAAGPDEFDFEMYQVPRQSIGTFVSTDVKETVIDRDTIFCGRKNRKGQQKDTKVDEILLV